MLAWHCSTTSQLLHCSAGAAVQALLTTGWQECEQVHAERLWQSEAIAKQPCSHAQPGHHPSDCQAQTHQASGSIVQKVPNSGSKTCTQIWQCLQPQLCCCVDAHHLQCMQGDFNMCQPGLQIASAHLQN